MWNTKLKDKMKNKQKIKTGRRNRKEKKNQIWFYNLLKNGRRKNKKKENSEPPVYLLGCVFGRHSPCHTTNRVCLAGRLRNSL